MLRQLIHNGIVIPPSPEPLGLSLAVRGRMTRLTPKQEEMALAWAHKKDTPYVKDPVFQANFLGDFARELGLEPPLRLAEVDFRPLYDLVDAERAAKEALSKEERKALAAERKAEREALKARYGYAIANGQRVELGTYMTEPSGIFMGRGQHPLRGRWKEGAKQNDVTLNLSPDAPPIEGQWGEVVWQPESLWVAKWEDKLAGKLKYIWLGDTAPIKQRREADKFDKAIRLEAQIDVVRQEIQEALVDQNPRRRMIATACYLIDALCLRVGDEKDPDEADTVGATTLRPEHITLREDGEVEFRFLGKDSVEWHKTLRLPEVVLANLAELSRTARPSSSAANGDRGHPTRNLPQLFPDVTSRDVNAFLQRIMPGLTAKVFRTHHASIAVKGSLEGSGVETKDPEYMKWRAATMANLEAATLCNHTKQASGDWAKTRSRYQERQARAEERLERLREEIKELTAALNALREEARAKEEAEAKPEARKKVRERYRKRLQGAQLKLEAARERRSRAQVSLGKLKAQAMIAGKKRTWNLGTSLKSYIDPRVYHTWGQKVEYDVLGRYYPTILRRKFAWVRALDEQRALLEAQTGVSLRPGTPDDLAALVQLFAAVGQAHPALELPTTPEQVGVRFLPSLEGAWRETVVALDEDQVIVGFCAIGPEWQRSEGEITETMLDLFAVLRPGRFGIELAELLADEVRRCVEGFNLQHPRQARALWPRDDRWADAAPGFLEALGLEGGEDEEAEEEIEETEEPDDEEAEGDEEATGESSLAEPAIGMS